MRPAVHVLRALVLCYRYTLSAFIGRSCRFLPTCSEYALEALDKHGAARGTWLTLRRLARCHPWGGAGLDPVPDAGTDARKCHGTHHNHPSATAGGAVAEDRDMHSSGLRALKPDTQ